jgi:hypothetical protein
LLICFLQLNSVKHRRRTTQDQFDLLDAQFQESPKPDMETRKSLAAALGMTSREVQVWFQNRRAKQKKSDARLSLSATKGHASNIIYRSSTNGITPPPPYRGGQDTDAVSTSRDPYGPTTGYGSSLYAGSSYAGSSQETCQSTSGGSFHVPQPMHRQASRDSDGSVLLHPVTGPTSYHHNLNLMPNSSDYSSSSQTQNLPYNAPIDELQQQRWSTNQYQYPSQGYILTTDSQSVSSSTAIHKASSEEILLAKRRKVAAPPTLSNSYFPPRHFMANAQPLSSAGSNWSALPVSPAYTDEFPASISSIGGSSCTTDLGSMPSVSPPVHERYGVQATASTMQQSQVSPTDSMNTSFGNLQPYHVSAPPGSAFTAQEAHQLMPVNGPLTLGDRQTQQAVLPIDLAPRDQAIDVHNPGVFNQFETRRQSLAGFDAPINITPFTGYDCDNTMGDPTAPIAFSSGQMQAEMMAPPQLQGQGASAGGWPGVFPGGYNATGENGIPLRRASTSVLTHQSLMNVRPMLRPPANDWYASAPQPVATYPAAHAQYIPSPLASAQEPQTLGLYASSPPLVGSTNPRNPAVTVSPARAQSERAVSTEYSPSIGIGGLRTSSLIPRIMSPPSASYAQYSRNAAATYSIPEVPSH